MFLELICYVNCLKVFKWIDEFFKYSIKIRYVFNVGIFKGLVYFFFKFFISNIK